MSKNKLKLQQSDKFPCQDKYLSMDEYIEFVNFCANNLPRNKLSLADEIAMHRGVPFSIK